MSYDKQNFVSGQILTAAQLNHMEDGIANAAGTRGEKGNPGPMGAKGDKGDPGAGLTDTEKTLLLNLFENAAYKTDTSIKAQQLRNDAFTLTARNVHPGLRGHEYRSTIIENWMRGL